jgi:transposase
MSAVIGVDPRKHVLSTVALDERGGVLGHWHGEMSVRGISTLQKWAAEQAPGATWAIEGSNLGRRLALALVSAGGDVRDVSPTRTADRRRQRPGRGKSGAVDAEAIARELLAHPGLPRAFKGAVSGVPDPIREELVLLVRTRQQLVDRHRRLLNEAEALMGELPAELVERLPRAPGVAPRLTAVARLHLTNDRLTNLRLQFLRAKAREHRVTTTECALLERQIGQLLNHTRTNLPTLPGLGPLGAAELLVEVGDPRRFPSADAFASYAGTAPIPASSAEVNGRPVHHRLSRFGNRRLNAALYIMAVTCLRSDARTQTYVARLLAAGKTKCDALRILKHRLARVVWSTMMRDLAALG